MMPSAQMEEKYKPRPGRKYHNPAAKFAAHFVHGYVYDLKDFTEVDIAYGQALKKRLIELGYPMHRVEHELWMWARTKNGHPFPDREYGHHKTGMKGTFIPFADRIGPAMVIDLHPALLDADGDLSVEHLQNLVAQQRPRAVLLRHGAQILTTVDMTWTKAPPKPVTYSRKVNQGV